MALRKGREHNVEGHGASGVQAGVSIIVSDANTGGRSVGLMHAAIESYINKSQPLEEKVQELDEKIAAAQREIMDIKATRAAASAVGVANASVLVSRHQQKELSLKEALLVRLRGEDNEGRAACSQLRRQIDTQRTDQMHRSKRFNQLSGELTTIRNQLVAGLSRGSELVAEKNAIAETRRRALAEAEEAQNVFETECTAVVTQLASLQQLAIQAARDALKLAGPDAGGAAEEEEGPGSGNLTEEQEQDARDNILKLNNHIKSMEAVVADLHQQTFQLQEIFRHMIAQAGVDTVEQLVDRFTFEEGFKYEIYGYVQHTNAESKTYEEALDDIRAAQASHSAQMEAMLQGAREETDSMHADLEALYSARAAAQEYRQDLLRLSRAVLGALVAVYAACGGDDPSKLTLIAADQATQGRRKAAASRIGKIASTASAVSVLAAPSSPRGSSSFIDPSMDFMASGIDSAPAEEVDSDALLVSVDEVIGTLGDSEQKCSDLCITYGNLLRSETGRSMMIFAVEALGRELETQAAASDEDSDDESDDGRRAPVSRTSTMDRRLQSKQWQRPGANRRVKRSITLRSQLQHLAELRNVLASLRKDDIALLLQRLNKGPEIPSRVGPGASTRPHDAASAAVASIGLPAVSHKAADHMGKARRPSISGAGRSGAHALGDSARPRGSDHGRPRAPTSTSSWAAGVQSPTADTGTARALGWSGGGQQLAARGAFPIGGGGWDPLESTCRHASLSIL